MVRCTHMAREPNAKLTITPKGYDLLNDRLIVIHFIMRKDVSLSEELSSEFRLCYLNFLTNEPIVRLSTHASLVHRVKDQSLETFVKNSWWSRAKSRKPKWI